MNILLADDHALLRDSLSLVLQERFGTRLQLLHAADGPDTLAQIDAHTGLDLVLLDIDLPGIDGFQVLKQALQMRRGLRVIMISGSCSPNIMRHGISLGAAGFIPKTFSSNAMLSAIELVLAGGSFVPGAALQGAAGANQDRTDSAPRLTDRQLEVIRLIRKGLSNEEIAAALDISLPTVKTHVHGILETLGTKNRTEAVNEALLLNLI